MTTGPFFLLALLVILAAASYLSWVAGRIDRMHARVEGARHALDAQLLRRSAVALELATAGLLDPAASVLLADAAHAARAASAEDRELRESDLSSSLRAVLGEPETLAALSEDPAGRDLVDELGAAVRRIQLARRFHNDAVRATVALRRQLLVRYLRLAGRAPLPTTFEIDDLPPEPFTR